jgi:penicillin-binding protein 1A
MEYALRNIPVAEMTPPEGVVNIGGEWFYEEYTRSSGVRDVGLDSTEDESSAASAPSAAEKRNILELFDKPAQ